jgi:hypothetical protein
LLKLFYYLNASIQNELHQLILQAGDRGVEAVGHLMKVSRTVRGEVLNQPTVPDHGEQGVDVRGQVDVQQEIVLHLLQQLQTLSIPTDT